MKPVWIATSGPCTVDGSGCMVSTNYKSGAEDKDADECEGKTAKYAWGDLVAQGHILTSRIYPEELSTFLAQAVF